jgi:GAF domain-containing protein/HAMP domain-containing protein
MLLGIRWGSLRTRIVAWSFVPTLIILVLVALVIFYAYQEVTAELVIERNQELTRLSASQFIAELQECAGILDTEARAPDIHGSDPVAQRDALKGASNRLAVFDAGVLILDTFGRVVAAEPERPQILGQDWSDRSYYRQILRSQIRGSPGPVLSDIVADGPGGADVVVVALPIIGPRGEFVGTIAGLFRVDATAVSPFYARIVKLQLGESGSAYLVDGQGRVIYHSDHGRIGGHFSVHPVVRQVLDGQVGAIRTRDLDGREMVASFAPVPGTSWGLVSQESWTALISASRGYQQFLVFLLALGMVVPALVVAVGVRRITRPIVELIGAAQEVAGGNFGQAISARTGDEIEELAEQFNLMAAQLQQSYTHLERRVADRTRELAALNAIATTVSQSLDLDEVLNDALNKTLEVMEIESGGIYLLDAEAKVLTVAAHRGFSSQFVAGIDSLKVGEGFSGRVAQSGQPLVARDISADPRLTRMVVREEGLRSLASVPLSSRGNMLGTLFAVTRGYREFSDQDVQLLTSIGHQVGVAIENARLFEAESRRRQEATLLVEMARLISGTLDLDEVLRLTAQYAVDVFDVHCCCVFLYDEGEGTLRPAVHIGFEDETTFAADEVEFSPSEGMRQAVFDSLEPLIIEDVPSDPHLRPRDLLDLQSALVVPIEVGGRRLGALQLGTRRPRWRRFTTDEGELALAMANQAAVAIDEARLYAAEQRRAEEFRIIAEVGHRITSILDIDEVLVQVVGLIQKVSDYYHVGIGLVEGDEVVYRVGAGVLWDDPQFQFRPGRLKVGEEGVSGWVAATGMPLLVPDVRKEPRYVWMRGSRTRSELTVPITTKGETIGVLDVQSDRLNAFDESDLVVLQSLASQTAIAIDNARLFEAEQRRAEQFRVISEMGRRITSILAEDELLVQIARLIQEAFNYYLVEIGLIEGEELVYKARAGRDRDSSFESFRLMVGQEGVTGWVAATGEPLLIRDVSQEPRYVRVTATETRSELAMPIKAKDKVTAVLNVESDRLNAFDDIDLVVLQSLAHQTGAAIENARLYEQAQQLAVVEERQRLARELHDAVTQTLFSASLIAETLPALWAIDEEEGRQLLRELQQLSRGALAEMRSLLLELRPAALLEAPLGDLLRQLSDAVTGRIGIAVTVTVEGQCAFPDDVHVALYRITQEALNNVVKHARASEAAVSLRCSSTVGEYGAGRSVELRVSDDGIGFDPGDVEPGELGLGIMHERAQSIGASLRIESQPSHGTQVTALWEGQQDLIT